MKRGQRFIDGLQSLWTIILIIILSEDLTLCNQILHSEQKFYTHSINDILLSNYSMKPYVYIKETLVNV